MKNLSALFTLVTLLFLTSCAKEEIIQLEPTPETIQAIQAKEDIKAASANTNYEAKGSATLVSVTTDSYSIVGNELIVDFSSNYDFSTSIVEANQQLKFVDMAGNISSLNFQINSLSAGNGYLDVTFAIGGNNLTGLGMEVGQGIVIEDIHLD